MDSTPTIDTTMEEYALLWKEIGEEANKKQKEIEAAEAANLKMNQVYQSMFNSALLKAKAAADIKAQADAHAEVRAQLAAQLMAAANAATTAAAVATLAQQARQQQQAAAATTQAAALPAALPTALPTAPALPALSASLLAGLPSALPTALPTAPALSAGLPAGLPTAIPAAWPAGPEGYEGYPQTESYQLPMPAGAPPQPMEQPLQPPAGLADLLTPVHHYNLPPPPGANLVPSGQRSARMYRHINPSTVRKVELDKPNEHQIDSPLITLMGTYLGEKELAVSPCSHGPPRQLRHRKGVNAYICTECMLKWRTKHGILTLLDFGNLESDSDSEGAPRNPPGMPDRY